MQQIALNRTTDGYDASVEVNGPATVWIDNDSVFDDAQAIVEGYADNTEAKFVGVGLPGVATGPGPVFINGTGTYRLRLRVKNAKANTNINAVVTN